MKLSHEFINGKTVTKSLLLEKNRACIQQINRLRGQGGPAAVPRPRKAGEKTP